MKTENNFPRSEFIKDTMIEMLNDHNWRNYGSSEQYRGMRAEYKISRDETTIRIKIQTFKGRDVSVSVDIPIVDFLSRPARGQDKNEAKWAFALCGM